MQFPQESKCLTNEKIISNNDRLIQEQKMQKIEYALHFHNQTLLQSKNNYPTVWRGVARKEAGK